MIQDYMTVVRIYEKDLVRRAMGFFLMSVVAIIGGVAMDNILIAISSAGAGGTFALLCCNGGKIKLGLPKRMQVVRSAHPTDRHTSRWRIEYQGYTAPIELSQLESLRSRHNLVEVSDD